MKRARWSLVSPFFAALLAAGCMHAPAPVLEDEPLKLAREAGEAAFSQGDYDTAAGLFAEALNRASIRDDGRAAARCRYQLAACRIAQGRLAEAPGLLEAARDEALLAGDEGAAARAETALARVKLETGIGEAAAHLAAQALRRPGVDKNGRLAADLHLILAEAALKRGDKARAAEALQEAAKRMGRKQADPFLAAVYARLRGRMLLDEAPGKAGAVFDEESAAWQRARRPGESAAALEQAGHAYGKAGLNAVAADRMYRAARIRCGLKQVEQAIEAADLAAEWAKAAGLTVLHVRAQAVMTELRDSEKP